MDNLVRNALTHGNNPALTLRKVGNFAEVTVESGGETYSAAEVATWTEPFARAERTAGRRPQARAGTRRCDRERPWRIPGACAAGRWWARRKAIASGLKLPDVEQHAGALLDVGQAVAFVKAARIGVYLVDVDL